MKKLKIIVFIISILLGACSNDREKYNLVGKWEVSSIYLYNNDVTLRGHPIGNEEFYIYKEGNFKRLYQVSLSNNRLNDSIMNDSIIEYGKWNIIEKNKKTFLHKEIKKIYFIENGNLEIDSVKIIQDYEIYELNDTLLHLEADSMPNEGVFHQASRKYIKKKD